MNKINEDIKNLVVARLQTLPSDKKISIGADGDFTKDEIIEHVQKGDKIGLKMINIEMEFLRAFKEGFVS